ncbi:MAG: hypothetical protein ACYDCN_14685 [Bacteroidia bacterium]
MLLNILKINNYSASVYLLLFSFGLGLFTVNLGIDAAIFSNSVLSYFIETVNLGVLSKTGGIILLLVNILVFDLMMTSQEISEKNNHVPALLLSVFLCYALSQNPLHPILFGQLLISGSMWYFLAIYKSDKVLSSIFNGAFCLSAASIFYSPFSLFIAMGFICLSILISFSLREWILAIIGIVFPYFFYFSLLFLFDKNLQQPVLNLANTFHAPSIPIYLKGSFLINFAVGFMSVFTLVFFLSKTVSNKIKAQKGFIIFMWMLVLSIPTWFVVNTGITFSAFLSAMPLSVFCGIYLGNTKSRIFAELLLWFLLSMFIISMLQQANVI